MKSRHLSAMHTVHHRRFWRALPWLGAFVVFCLGASAFAQEASDPPARVAHVSARQGSVVFAPAGEDEWTELPQNRPLTAGDRLWNDRGARAELHLGAATLHVDEESHLGLSDLDERAAQFILQQGTVNARVRELVQGENFEIGTPNIAFRALQPGDYRIDVDAQTQQTRVIVTSGLAAIYGEGGDAVHLGAGQQASFAGRFLAQVQSPPLRADVFAQWAAERNRVEDQSIAAHHVPRGVVGYAQLDQHGTWSNDPGLGTVWYPRVAVQDWAPYRYGHWSWIQPWGWTWIDDAPWGFAPFHYGRWTMIGSRWAWVPGRLAARPVYSPALVVFLGGGGTQFSLNVGSGPGVGWYPLAPGEAWWPVYRTTPRYVNHANLHINLGAYPRHYTDHVWRHRTHGITAVRDDDFRRGRPVHRHWQPLRPQVIRHAQVGVVPVRPEGRHSREVHVSPRLHSAPPQALPQRFWGRHEVAPAVREQFRAQREQDRLQRDAERAAREQMRQQEQARQQDGLRMQREQFLRQQQEQAARIHQERTQREAWQHRQEQAQREAWQQHQQQERAQRDGWRIRRGEREPDQPRFVAPQQVRPVQGAPLNRGEDRGHRVDRGGDRGNDHRGGGRWDRGGDDHRGRGHWNR